MTADRVKTVGEVRGSQMCVQRCVCERPEGVNYQRTDCDVCDNISDDQGTHQFEKPPRATLDIYTDKSWTDGEAQGQGRKRQASTHLAQICHP